MASGSSTRNEQAQGSIQQPRSQFLQENSEEGPAMSSPDEPSSEKDSFLDFLQESPSRRTRDGPLYTGITAGNRTRNIWGNVSPYIKRMYNSFENRIAEKEYRLKKIMGVFGICLFFLSAAVGLSFYLIWYFLIPMPKTCHRSLKLSDFAKRDPEPTMPPEPTLSVTPHPPLRPPVPWDPTGYTSIWTETLTPTHSSITLSMFSS